MLPARTRVSRNQWCVETVMPNKPVILVALSSHQIHPSCGGYDCAWPHGGVGFDRCVAQQRPWRPREMPVHAAGKGELKMLERLLWKPQSTGGTKMMSLAYFKLADVASIFVIFFKSSCDPLSTRKWSFHTAVSNPETVSSAHKPVRSPVNILYVSSKNFHPETLKSPSPSWRVQLWSPLLPSQHLGSLHHDSVSLCLLLLLLLCATPPKVRALAFIPCS